MHPSLYRKTFPFPPPHNATQRICSNTFHLRPTVLKTSKNSYSAVQPPTLPAPDHHPISARSCDQPMVEIDEDFDLDELLLRLTGHEVPSAFPLADAYNDATSGLNPSSLL